MNKELETPVAPIGELMGDVSHRDAQFVVLLDATIEELTAMKRLYRVHGRAAKSEAILREKTYELLDLTIRQMYAIKVVACKHTGGTKKKS